MTKYDDQVETRCPECGTIVQLTDTKCPRCEHFLAYGYNVKRDKMSLSYKYQRLPKWLRACFLAVSIALFVIAIANKSALCLLLSFLLFLALLTLGKRTIVAFLIPGLRSGVPWSPYNIYAEKEPWDKALYDPTAPKEKSPAGSK